LLRSFQSAFTYSQVLQLGRPALGQLCQKQRRPRLARQLHAGQLREAGHKAPPFGHGHNVTMKQSHLKISDLIWFFFFNKISRKK
jgi:hypothetical protein